MDIPNTGAIFTLGKSHLAENTQSYFYIKNDPVKSLISGANQSAVICESGRLFVWGENHHGQLGLGTSHDDIINKPTCVKALKTLGLKIADTAFGLNWAVILTHSNEIFFTGQSIFATNTKVAANFTSATIHGKKCSIIRKPFRLTEFDDCLRNSEDPENFTCISAGNAHFTVMTSLGRLFGWGSNTHHQLGSQDTELKEPHEITLHSKVKKFVCGPTSTLILTEDGNLYLTGQLNEFMFPQFTELQQNLSEQEEVIFMHISQSNEIYIVTNEGGIYRSIESARHSSLIFQRFYDYDSEENGQIVKLLRGTSFYAALTKANKFYTTFSESGHHLKTFREISKFRNLRTLDVVVGDQHILVYGVPKSSNKFMNKTFVLGPDANANTQTVSGSTDPKKNSEENKQVSETIKPNTPVREKLDDTTLDSSKVYVDIKEEINANDATQPYSEDTKKQSREMSPAVPAQTGIYQKLDESEIESNSSTPSKKTILTANADSISPTPLVQPRDGSARSIRFDEKSMNKTKSAGGITRPRTPYPNDATHNIIETSVENVDLLDKTTLAFNDSLENIPETVANFQTENKSGGKPRKATPIHRPIKAQVLGEEDERLIVEINSTDFLNKSVVNEIRFINNGIDVTDHVEQEPVVKNESAKISANEPVQGQLDKAKEILHTVSDKVTKEAKEVHGELKELYQEDHMKMDKAVDSAKNSTEQAISAIDSKIETITKETDNNLNKLKYDAADETTKIGHLSQEAGHVLESTKKTVKHEIETKMGDVSQSVQSTVGAFDKTINSIEGNIEQAVEKTKSEVGTMKDNAEHTVERKVDEISQDTKNTVKTIKETTTNVVENKIEEVSKNTEEAIESTKATTGDAINNALHTADDKLESISNETNTALGKVSNEVKSAFSKVSSGMDAAVDKMSTKLDSAVSTISEGVDNTISSVSQTMSTTVNKLSNKVDDAKHNITNLFTGGSKESAHRDSNASTIDAPSTPKSGSKHDDDERTTASVNSNISGNGNPFENENDRDEVHHYDAAKHSVGQEADRIENVGEPNKGKIRQFFDDIKAKGKGISCMNEKAIRIADDPPKYTPVDEYSQDTNKTSKVCTIF